MPFKKTGKAPVVKVIQPDHKDEPKNKQVAKKVQPGFVHKAECDMDEDCSCKPTVS